MGEDLSQRLPPAYAGCTCLCHRQPGVVHTMACCYPDDEMNPNLMDRPKYPDGSVIMDEHVTAEHVAELAARLEKAEEALRFYADLDRYRTGSITADAGQTARATLSQTKEPTDD